MPSPAPPPPRSHPRTCLCVFLKAPRPGHVKTRLAATLGAAAAARIYRAFVRDTLGWAARCPVDTRRIDHAPPDAAAEVRALLPSPPASFVLHPQVEGDLGRRMRHSFDAMFAAGHERCAIVGTDCPALGPAEVAAALAALTTADVVLGPTVDGGYYLIALRRAAPELFGEIPWSTADVLDTTLARCRDAGLATHLLPRLRDVDTADDLAALREQLGEWRRAGREPFPRHTAEIVARA